jgi:hypothetical protein
MVVFLNNRGLGASGDEQQLAEVHNESAAYGCLLVNSIYTVRCVDFVHTIAFLVLFSFLFMAFIFGSVYQLNKD